MNRQEYSAVGIDVIPLHPNTKRPLCDGWPELDITLQWTDAPRTANGGIRHNGHVLNIDADNKAVSSTSEHVSNGLAGLGITATPIVQTASGIGRAFYIRCEDAPDGVALRKLSASIGAGELRVGAGAMSVLPPSRIDGRAYELLAGDWHAMPVVQWRDLLWLLPAQRTVTQADALPVRLVWRYAPRGTAELFTAIANANAGDAVGRYSSRSDAEAAIVTRLILSGWPFAEVLQEFKRRNCGHYGDAGRHADRYLATTYANALAAIMAHDVRQAVAIDYNAAEADAWPGRTGNSDKAVYMALLSECYKAGAVETTASVRELSEHAAVAVGTASKSLQRLAVAGRLQRSQAASQDGQTAAVWRIDNRLAVIEQVSQIKDCSITATPPIVTSVQLLPVYEVAELSSRAGLGKSAVSVYRQLDTFKAVTVSELARRTGRSRGTVRTGLQTLAHYSLAAVTDGGTWLAGTNTLESVARELDCIGLADTRRQRHEHERAKYAKWIALRKEQVEVEARSEA